MKHYLLLSTAAVALSLALAPAMAQSDQNRKAPETQHRQNVNGPSSHEMKRSTTGQSTADENKSERQNSAAPSSETTRDRDSARDNQTPRHDEGADRRNGDQNQSAQEKRGTDQNKAAQEKRGTDQNQTAQPRDRDTNGTQRNATNPDRNSNSARSNESRPGNDQHNTARRDDNAGGRVSASLDPQRKERLHSAFARLDVRPIDRVDFSISVGTVVPTHVHVRPLPSTIVEIVPQYRGYDFFVVRDEIVIVQPSTHKIVDVIERGPSHARAESEEKVKLSTKQRDIIRKHVNTHRTVTTGSAPRETVIEIGESVPESVQIESFPEEVYREVPEIRSYRYIERGDDVYLVDPGTREVIEEIR
jgi:hypothetical protein